jgi:pyruvate formate lyase activating enzyme
MILGGLQKTSLIDYPDKVSAIVFTSGCNFNCHYCYNPELRNYSHGIDEDYFFSFLNKRKNQLDAIVVTGGEPTVHADLPEFIAKIKKLGFLVKLDTQGTNPKMVKELIDFKLIDYVAMDIKGPLNKYREIANCFVNEKAIKETIKILKTSDISYEFRTTIVSGQLVLDDFEKIGKLIKGASKYYLQAFVPKDNLNDKEFSKRKAPSKKELEEMKNIVLKYVKEVFIR